MTLLRLREKHGALQLSVRLLVFLAAVSGTLEL